MSNHITAGGIKMIVCTSICANYLPKAAVLAQSLKTYNPQYRMVACLVEDEIDASIETYRPFFDDMVLAKDMGIENFYQFIFRYDIVEASTAVKGRLFQYLLRTYPDERKFMYLDPDIEVFHSFSKLEDILDEHSIVLTPHMCEQERNDDVLAIIDNEVNSSLKYGVFNLGFLAISRTPEGERFIDWWTSRLNLFCYDDMFDRGIFTDQRWIDLAPCLFDVYILKDLGYNMAPWNVSTRRVTSDLLVNGRYPLVFFHFSGFDSGANETVINRYVPDKSEYIYTLRNAYIEKLKQNDFHEMSRRPWSYGYYRSGEKIEKEIRRLYRDKMEMFKEYLVDPFDESNDSIRQFYPKVLKGKKVYIWGTGSAGLRTLQYYKERGIEFAGWIDSNREKHGKTLEGMAVHSPGDILSSYERGKHFIILGTSFYNEITPLLRDAGLEQHADYLTSQILYQ
jgi:hypothetical protein